MIDICSREKGNGATRESFAGKCVIVSSPKKNL
jgi:hypothetical protein